MEGKPAEIRENFLDLAKNQLKVDCLKLLDENVTDYDKDYHILLNSISKLILMKKVQEDAETSQRKIDESTIFDLIERLQVCIKEELSSLETPDAVELLQTIEDQLIEIQYLPLGCSECNTSIFMTHQTFVGMTYQLLREEYRLIIDENFNALGEKIDSVIQTAKNNNVENDKKRESLFELKQKLNELYALLSNNFISIVSYNEANSQNFGKEFVNKLGEILNPSSKDSILVKDEIARNLPKVSEELEKLISKFQFLNPPNQKDALPCIKDIFSSKDPEDIKNLTKCLKKLYFKLLTTQFDNLFDTDSYDWIKEYLNLSRKNHYMIQHLMQLIDNILIRQTFIKIIKGLEDDSKKAMRQIFLSTLNAFKLFTSSVNQLNFLWVFGNELFKTKEIKYENLIKKLDDTLTHDCKGASSEIQAEFLRYLAGVVECKDNIPIEERKKRFSLIPLVFNDIAQDIQKPLLPSITSSLFCRSNQLDCMQAFYFLVDSILRKQVAIHRKDTDLCHRVLQSMLQQIECFESKIDKSKILPQETIHSQNLKLILESCLNEDENLTDFVAKNLTYDLFSFLFTSVEKELFSIVPEAISELRSVSSNIWIEVLSKRAIQYLWEHAGVLGLKPDEKPMKNNKSKLDLVQMVVARFFQGNENEMLMKNLGDLFELSTIPKIKQSFSELMKHAKKFAFNDKDFIFYCESIVKMKISLIVSLSHAKQQKQILGWAKALKFACDKIQNNEYTFAEITYFVEVIRDYHDYNEIAPILNVSNGLIKLLMHQFQLTMLKAIIKNKEFERFINDDDNFDIMRFGSSAGQKCLLILIQLLSKYVIKGKPTLTFDVFQNVYQLILDTGMYREFRLINKLENKNIATCIKELKTEEFSRLFSSDLDGALQNDFMTKLVDSYIMLEKKYTKDDIISLFNLLQKRQGLNALILYEVLKRFESNKWVINESTLNELYNSSPDEWITPEKNSALENYRSENIINQRSFEQIIAGLKKEPTGVNQSIAPLLALSIESKPSSNGVIASKPFSNMNLKDLCEAIVRKVSYLQQTEPRIEKKDVQEWARVFKALSSDKLKLDIMVIELCSYLSYAVKHTEGYLPRNTQLTAVLLFIDGIRRGTGRIAKIDTGEGKTLIVQMLAVVRALNNQTTDVITTSSVLATPHSKMAVELLSYFNINVSNNCDSDCQTEIERKKRYANCEVIYGDSGSFQRDFLLTKYLGKNLRKNGIGDCVIIDEADSALIDNAQKTLYLSHAIEDLQYLRELFLIIWSAIQNPEFYVHTQNNVSKVLKVIQSQIADKSITIPGGRYLDEFIKRRLKTWIKSAYTARDLQEGDQYVEASGGEKRGQAVVMDLYTGVEQLNTQWSNGLQQFIQLKHRNKMSDESLKAIFISNISFFREYKSNLNGLTGTLGGPHERKFMSDNYTGLDFFILPRYMPEQFIQEDAIIVATPDQWENEVKNDVKEKLAHELICKNSDNSADIPVNDEDIIYDFNSEYFKAENTTNNEGELNHLFEDNTLRLTNKISDLQKRCNESSTRFFTLNEFNELIEVNNQKMESRIRNVSNNILVTRSKEQRLIPITMGSKILKSIIHKHEREISYSEKKIAEYEDELIKAQKEITALQAKIQSLPIKNIVSSSEMQQYDIKGEEKIRKLKLRLDEMRQNSNSHSNIDFYESPEEIEVELAQLKNQKDKNTNKSTIEMVQEGYKDAVARRDERKNHMDIVIQKIEKIKKFKLILENKLSKYQKELVGYELKKMNKQPRSSLVITENQLAARTLYQKVLDNYPKDLLPTSVGDQMPRVEKYDTALTEFKHTILAPGDVIIATNIAGRGTDLGTTVQLEENNGPAVSLSYIPESDRIAVQAFGRTARNGKKGSGRYIVWDPRAADYSLTISQLLLERDEKAATCLALIQHEKLPRIFAEEKFFALFANLQDKIRDKLISSENDEDYIALQIKSLQDRWAFWLDRQDAILSEVHNIGDEILNREFDLFFHEALVDLTSRPFGLIDSVGELTKLSRYFYQVRKYSYAEKCCDMIIATEPEYSAYAHYYKAQVIFAQEERNTLERKKLARDELKTAIKKLENDLNRLATANQIIKLLGERRQKSGMGLEVDYFTTSNINQMSIINVHLDAAKEQLGQVLSEKSLTSGPLVGDEVGKAFHHLRQKTPKLVKNYRVSKKIEIQHEIFIDLDRMNSYIHKLSKELSDKIRGTNEGNLILQTIAKSDLDMLRENGVSCKKIIVRPKYKSVLQNKDSKDNLHVVQFTSLFSPITDEVVKKIEESQKKRLSSPKQKAESQEMPEKELLDFYSTESFEIEAFKDLLFTKEHFVYLLKQIGSEETLYDLHPKARANALGVELWEAEEFLNNGIKIKLKIISDDFSGVSQDQLTLKLGECFVDNSQKSNSENLDTIIKTLKMKDILISNTLYTLSNKTIEEIKKLTAIIRLTSKLTSNQFKSLNLANSPLSSKMHRLRRELMHNPSKLDFDVNDLSLSEEDFEYLWKTLNSYGYLQYDIFSALTISPEMSSQKSIPEYYKNVVAQTLLHLYFTHKEKAQDKDSIIIPEEAIPFSESEDDDLKILWSQLVEQEVVKKPSVRFMLVKEPADQFKMIKKEIAGQVNDILKNVNNDLFAKINELEAKIPPKIRYARPLDIFKDEDWANFRELIKLEKQRSEYEDALKKVFETIIGKIKFIRDLKIEHKILDDFLKEGKMPPEIVDFTRRFLFEVLSLVEDRGFSFDAFFCALLGVLQIIAGCILTMVGGGALGQMLIREGVNDVVYAVQSAIAGNFSWEAYAERKLLSLAVTVATVSFSTIIDGKQFFEPATKEATSSIVSSVAKESVAYLGEAFVEIGVSQAASALIEEASKSILKGLIDGIVDGLQTNQAIVDLQGELQEEFKRACKKFGNEQARKKLRKF